MSRPKLTLQEWLKNEQEFKFKFLKKECNHPQGLIDFDQGNNCFKNRDLAYPHNSYTHHIQFNNGVFLTIDDTCFNKLKAKYRIFKKNKKDSNLVSKNFKLTKHTADYIKSTKEKNGWSREEDVIEDIINNIQNFITKEKTITQLQTKEIKLNILQSEIKNNNHQIQNLEQDKSNLTIKLSKIKKLLAIELLKNEYYKRKLKDNNLSTEHPEIYDEIIQKKVLELEDILKTGI